MLAVYREGDRRTDLDNRFRLQIVADGAQINLGTGKDVSDETIADAKVPLEIQRSGDSFIDLDKGNSPL